MQQPGASKDDVEAQAPGGEEATERTPLLEKENESGAGHRASALAQKAGSAAAKTVTVPAHLMRNSIDTMFMRQWNSRFADHAELACRSGLYVTLLMLPSRFHLGERFNATDYIQRVRILSPEAMVQFVYTLYKTVGETIYLAWGGMFGSFLGSVYPWVMWGLYPEGVVLEHRLDPAFLAGWFFGIIFVVLILFLNFDMLTRIFALSTFVWHWMGFLDPSKRNGYSTGFTIKWGGPMVNMLLAAVSGSILAVLCTLLPYPLMATEKARASAKRIVGTTGQTWQHAVQFFLSGHSDPYAMARLERSMVEMNEEMSALKGHIDNSWWECFGMTKRHRRRRMLDELNSVIYETCERLTSIIMACMFEDFGASHVMVMDRVGEKLSDVTDGSHKLLCFLTEMACTGDLPTEEQECEVKEQVEALKKSSVQLAQEFRLAKEAAGMPKMSEELLSEHAFCFAASNYAHIANDFAEFICDPKFDERQQERPFYIRLPAIVFNGLAGVFDKQEIFDRMHLNWAMKNSLAVLLCFWIGWRGYSKMILDYSPGISSTCSVLLSKFSGSAMKKNLNRLQGVVIGTVVGELGFALLGWCNVPAKIVMLMMLGLWLSFTMFFYYDSVVYGGITCLMAAFGTKYFLKSCSEEVVDPTQTYYEIINVVICIVVMTLVDSVFSLGRPSLMAYEALVSSWQKIEDAVNKNMDGINVETRNHSGTIRNAIGSAEYLGVEAVDESRLWRTPWKKPTFDSAIRCAREVRVLLSNMEFSVEELDSGDGAQKDPLFQKVMGKPGFLELRRLILQNLQRTHKLLDIMVHEEDNEFPPLNSPEMKVNLHKAIHGAVCELIARLNEELEFQDVLGNEDLTKSTAARISVVFMSILGMNNSMRMFRTAAIRG